MLVQNGDFLKRGDQLYAVICADGHTFVVGNCEYNDYLKRRTISYSNLEAYSNDETINTLKDLGFIKEE